MSTKRLEELQRRLINRENEASSTYSQIKKIRRTEGLQISDHAILRHLERIRKVNIEEVKNQILTPQLKSYYEKLGDGTYPIDDGATRVVIKSGVVVTIIN